MSFVSTSSDLTLRLLAERRRLREIRDRLGLPFYVCDGEMVFRGEAGVRASRRRAVTIEEQQMWDLLIRFDERTNR